jgi:ATP-dependent DNA ligase
MIIVLSGASCDDQGIPDFNLRDRKYGSAQLYAFDILELDGQNLRREPIEARNERSPSC